MTNMPNCVELCGLKMANTLGITDPEILCRYKELFHQVCCGKMNLRDALIECSRYSMNPRPVEYVAEIIGTAKDRVKNYPKYERYDPSFRKKKGIWQWSAYEDQRLIMGVYLCNGDFEKVAKFVGNGRTKNQCSQRWDRTVNPMINKAPWTPEEEEMLEIAYHIHGASWIKIAAYLGTRTDVQCRYHYLHVMNGSSPKAIRSRQIREVKKSKEDEKKRELLLEGIQKILRSTDIDYLDEALLETSISDFSI
ncbi:Myb-like DNA-binding domain containing protein [Trichomonas vaginalis G3]|uniref:Myb-like DNA-binding domain containing protein n=1 Tax=Trichomonas vaginalis (strain ATCC PRA-98 / G3) TaxID=412133 RepID=A2FY36_TRIV3|nr:RNA polymerase II transcription regulator recruiting protein [Trichomonas vaginalis G3]EAX90169.1 Myb-like DNA-binding domain containing protein [Trichomonas vaginalis G3]KAI5505494.1 RNA polymerase II transcription regulator recruiting protein [Trichomonas vaginalis G3]|eukprot:XP_001303099.1 Myb-like DNA-binding domain containing protein [Trichomonas vaginalis G3]